MNGNDQHADESKPRGGRRETSRRQFFLNLGLLLVIVVSVAIWFHRHIEKHTVESIFVGGTLTIWGLFEIIRASLEWAAEDEMKALPQRILGSRGSTEYLILALVLSVLLHCFTSSLNVEYEPSADATKQYKVSVTYRTNNHPFLEPFDVTSEKRIEGRPFFFRGRTEPLRVRLLEPRGYEPIDIDFGFATRGYWRVPTDFKRKAFHLVRLVPSPKLMQRLPEPGQNGQAEYLLELVRNGRTNLVTRLRRQVTYIGAGDEDMKSVIEQEKAEVRRAAMDEFLAQVGFPSEGRSPVMETWDKNPAFATTEEFGKNETIEVRVRSKNDSQFLIRSAVTNGENHEIKNLFLQL
jgi:hypothetical protein